MNTAHPKLKLTIKLVRKYTGGWFVQALKEDGVCVEEKGPYPHRETCVYWGLRVMGDLQKEGHTVKPFIRPLRKLYRFASPDGGSLHVTPKGSDLQTGAGQHDPAFITRRSPKPYTHGSWRKYQWSDKSKEFVEFGFHTSAASAVRAANSRSTCWGPGVKKVMQWAGPVCEMER